MIFDQSKTIYCCVSSDMGAHLHLSCGGSRTEIAFKVLAFGYFYVHTLGCIQHGKEVSL